VSRVAAIVVALVISASPLLAAICDATCAPASRGASAHHHGATTAQPVASTDDPHAGHHSTVPVAVTATVLDDASNCPGHVALVIAEARPLAVMQAPLLVARAFALSASPSRHAVPAAVDNATASRSTRAPVPLRI
jgi:hypothetical protein